MDQKKANDIQNRGTLLELSYVFTDAIKDVQNFEFTQNITTGTQYPRIEKDKEVTSVFRVNGTDVATTTYTQKGEPIGSALTGNFSMHSNGEIKLNSDNEFVSKSETITMITNSMEFETGTKFKLKINDVDQNFYKKLVDGEFPVVEAQAMGGATAGIAEVNEHGVILFGQRIKPKFQIVSLTQDTIEIKLVEGKMVNGYTYQFNLKTAGAERTLEDTTMDNMNSAKTEIRGGDGTVTVTGPDGQEVVRPTGSTAGVAEAGEIRWTLTGPNLSNMDGNFVTKHKALGNLAMSYVDQETGNSLIPSVSLINEQIADISKRKYDAKTPAEDLTNPSTDKTNNTVKNDVTAGDVTTLEVTPPYLIQDADGSLYTFAGYYETPADAPAPDPDDETAPTNTDPIGYPDAYVDGEIKDSKKLASGVQRIVAKYNKIKMGTVNVTYVIDGDSSKPLKDPTVTKYDGTNKLENAVGAKYDVTDIVAPEELTSKEGLVYVLDKADLPTEVTGTLTEGPINVEYEYLPKSGGVVHITYETEDGTEIGKTINPNNRFANPKLNDKGEPNTHVGLPYNLATVQDILPPEIVEGDVTYVPRPVDPATASTVFSAHKEGSAPLAGKVPATDATITFVYIPKQKAEIKYLLDTDKSEVAPTEKAEDTRGKEIALSTAATIKALEAKGYELVTDGFKAGTVYDNDAAATQTFEVVVKEKIVEIPEGAKPGEPVDPNNPDGPKWPDTITAEELNKLGTQEVNQVVDYLYAADKSDTPEADATDKVTFKRKLQVNLVTGDITPVDPSPAGWVADNADTTFDVKKSPVITGFLADKAQVEEKTNVGAEEEDAKYNEQVLYSPVGSYVVTTPDGNVVKTPYPNDPTDPTKPGVPTNVIPFVPGYTPVNPDGTPLTPVDPTDPSKGFLPPAIPGEYGKDTPISYTKHELVTVSFEKGDGTEVAPKVSKEGFPGTDVPTEDVTKTITDLRAKGYSVKSNDVPAGVKFDNDPNAPQDYKVVVEEPVVPFDSETPPTEGTPIDPNNPDGPKWTPELIKAVTETATRERVTRTVKYVKADGTEASKEVSETLVFERETKINVVTKEIITGEWTAKDTTFDEVKSPVVTGFLADKALVPAKDGVVATDADSEELVTYSPIGSYVVTTPGGDVVKTPYPNDPTDPTKPGVPTNVIPFVPGHTPVDGDGNPLKPVDPTDPSKGYNPPALPTEIGNDTPISYVKHEIVTVAFKDKGGKEVAPILSLDGFPGTDVPREAIDRTIEELRAKGYVVTENGVPGELKFDNDPKAPQDYVVVVEEPVVPFDPANPPKEGTPIDPTNPNGPKWTQDLIDLAKSAKVNEDVQRTINYVKEEDGSVAAPSVVDKVEFKRQAKINVVTKEITYGEWTPVADTTFEAVKSPEVAKYYAILAEVEKLDGVKVEDADLTVTVPYRLIETAKGPGLDVSELPVLVPETAKGPGLVAEDKPEIVIESEKGTGLTAEDKPELTIPSEPVLPHEPVKEPKVTPKPKPEAKPQAKAAVKAAAKPAKKVAKAGALPKTSAATETNSALPAGLAAALAAAGLLTARRRNEK